MSGATATDGAGLNLELAPGATGYVDSDWLPPEEQVGVPALVIDGSSTARWGAREASLPGGVDADRVAAAVFASAAQRAVAIATAGGTGQIALAGKGAIAREAARLLGTRLAEAGSEPIVAALDFSGDPEELARLTKLVQPLGRVVIAGRQPHDSFPFNLYPDVHVRGLRLNGIDPVDAVLAESLDLQAGTNFPAPETASARPFADGWLKLRSQAPATTSS